MGVGGFDSFLGVFRVLGPEISCVFFGFTTLNPTPPGLRVAVFVGAARIFKVYRGPSAETSAKTRNPKPCGGLGFRGLGFRV